MIEENHAESVRAADALKETMQGAPARARSSPLPALGLLLRVAGATASVGIMYKYSIRQLLPLRGGNHDIPSRCIAFVHHSNTITATAGLTGYRIVSLACVVLGFVLGAVSGSQYGSRLLRCLIITVSLDPVDL